MNINAAACVPIHAGSILAADVARAVPEFAAVPGDAVVGYAPMPGSRRVLRAVELRRIALKYNISMAAEREACFEWPLLPVSREDVVRAMRESLSIEGARIEVLDIGIKAVPEGKVTFPLTGLVPAADPNNGPALWRGYVAYGEKRRFDFWARVRLSAPTARVVALTNIAVGHVVEAGDVGLETVDDFPIWYAVARRLDEVVGRIARRGIAAGRAVLRSEVAQPLEVQAGDDVEVNVESGRAHLKMQGRAENSGRRGEMISVRNPRTGKTFRGQVEGKGRVVVKVEGI